MAKLNVVMNTFSGRYLGERSDKNIGHENINFYMPDNTNGKYLLWFNSDGVFPESRKEADGDITLLMVTNFANEKDKFRVLALAKNCHIIPGVLIPSQQEKAKKDRNLEFIKEFPNAKYGTVTIQKIFRDNTYHGNPDGKNTLATFYTEPQNVFVPKDKKTTIIISKDNKNADIKQNMANEKMRMFITNSNNNVFEQLINTIKWEQFDSQNKILPGYPKNSDNFKETDTFFSATRNDKDELTLSNIISFSLSKSQKLLSALVEELIKRPNVSNAEYLVKREDKHVDLTILLKDKTIIIENKVDSTIVEYGKDKQILREKIVRNYKNYRPAKQSPHKTNNSQKNNEKSQLYDWILKEVDSQIETIPEGTKLSQLTKYYIQSKIDAVLNGREEAEICYFLLVPDYSANKFTVDDKNRVIGYAFSEKYKLIKYSDLLTIFKSVKKYPYRGDIIKEFKLLGSEIDDFDQRWQIYNFLKKAHL